MITPFESYQLYVAIKQHFTGKNYDYFKYDGKVRVNEVNFDVRKDKYQFHKLSRQRDPKALLVSNFAEGQIKWPGDLFTEDAIAVYTRWTSYKEAMKHHFKMDCSKVKNDLAVECKSIDGQHPPLLRRVLRKEVYLQSLIILNDLLDFFPTWDSEIQDNIIWPKLKIKAMKARPFIEHDITLCKKVFLEVV